MDVPNQYKKNLFFAAIVFLIILSVYFAIKSIQEFGFVGNDGLENTITVSGRGEVNAVPDIATISFTIRGEAKTVSDAQEQVATIETKALEVLRTNEIEEKDIKTVSASFNPKYEYVYGTALPCNQYGCPPRPGKNTITGYQSFETISVKVRSIDTAGKIMEDLAAVGVTELSGPNFEIDEKDELSAEARKKAIDEAREKAKALAKDLGVRLVGVASFYEENDGAMYPMMYDSAVRTMANEAKMTAELPAGENTISSNVTITYRIR
ncbi:MAG TPA: SIMPL domain-containing protein [Candidatus Paceibacterota bacterium]|nr:SIMPL domain-containing protein [Candidatus Paceibacterota bacterium]